MKLRTKQKTLLFLILFAHVTLLDFAFISGKGKIVFLWQQSLELKTLLTHLLITIVALISFIGFNQLYQYLQIRKSNIVVKSATFVSVLLMFGYGITMV